MADTKFFTSIAPMPLQDVAQIGSCALGPDTNAQKLIRGVQPITDAGPDDITFLSNTKYVKLLAQSKAGACILAEKYVSKAPKGMALLVSNDPYVAYAKIAHAFYPEIKHTGEISSRAYIDETAQIGAGCHIEPGVFIGPHAVIGNHTFIGANSYIDKGVVIGDHCQIRPLVTISHAILGNHVLLHTGVRIGQDGFGFATERGVHLKVPQLGRVIIGNHVEMGANTCVDRGAGPDTIIGDGCKIDNLVQIGHNVELGKGCIIVSHVGISGSTKLGDYVVLGGQVGVAGHLTIGSFSSVAAQSGVAQDIPPKQIYGGSPAIPVKQWHRQTVTLKKLASKKAENE